MNTKNLKAYAPKARRQFIEAIQKRAAQFGIYEDRIAEVKAEGSSVIIEGRVFTKKQGLQRARLVKRLAERGYEMFTREMAYTWFNRLAAIRYMEIHDYLEHGFRVLSPACSNPYNAEGLPEILDYASDVADTLALDKSHIIELQLAGDKEEELYRELLLGQCHYLAKIMPFVFAEKGFRGAVSSTIDDATELLLPDNLTKTDSILKGLISEIPEEDWENIETIGWLYQFYISEFKKEISGLKETVISATNLPAATQIFTPNWIVKYLVQNSLGRQWLATYPESGLKGKMEYYIEPAKQTDEVIQQLKDITPASIDPEQIKVLDPAVGSGHILVEVYEVLREIYLERGYRLREIPELILTKNIYGLDIDDRAAQLAGFALMMKAREDDRRIFQRVEDGEVSLSVYSLQSTENMNIAELWQALNLEGNQQQGSTGELFDGLNDDAGSFVQPIGIYHDYFELMQALKSGFLLAKTLGSLIQIDNKHLESLVTFKELLRVKEKGSDPLAKQAALEFIPIINQAIILTQKYDALVANPPYLGYKGMNVTLKKYVESQFIEGKYDLYSAFIMKGFNLLKINGFNAQVTIQNWMCISSYSKLRDVINNQYTLVCLDHHEAGVLIGFETAAAIFRKTKVEEFITNFSFSTKQNLTDDKHGVFKVDKSISDFQKIQGTPYLYQLPEKALSAFSKYDNLEAKSKPRQGLATSDDNRFLRRWMEVDSETLSLPSNLNSTAKWHPFNKGGDYRKWYGNNEIVINWESDGKEVKEYAKSLYGSVTRTIKNIQFYFKEGLTWSLISSRGASFRYVPKGFIYGHKGSGIFSETLASDAAFLNSCVANTYLKSFSSGVGIEVGHIKSLPLCRDTSPQIEQLASQCIELVKKDWDEFEISWDFAINPIVALSEEQHQKQLSDSFKDYFTYANETVETLKDLETQINEYWSQVYGLPNKDISEHDLTIFKNINYRYQGDEEKKNKFQSDSLIELMSYAMGAMMGRYSLDREGLVYAHSGNKGFKQFIAKETYRTFPADDDGIIPLASEDWLFDDDATTRFKEFVKAVWGNEHLVENLEFVAESLCLHALNPKKGEGAMDTVRRYFSTHFFKYHCKTYKKRPIYWLFSSGKEKAFECLVYLHRYNEGTLSRMRTEYVTPLMGKYDAQHTLLAEQQIQATGTEARIIEKDLKALDKKQAELRAFDEQLKHFAEKRITLDLDHGVKANYGKFGNLLADVKAIHGKAVK